MNEDENQISKFLLNHPEPHDGWDWVTISLIAFVFICSAITIGIIVYYLMEIFL